MSFSQLTHLTKCHSKIYEKLSKKYSNVIGTSENLFSNYTNLRKEYISLSNKIGSITDILGLIDRLHDHQHDTSDSKERLQSIISQKPQLQKILEVLIADDGSFSKHLEELYPLTDLAVHLLQDHVEETDPQSRSAWIKRNHPELINGDFGTRKRRASTEDHDESKKRIKTE